MRIRALGGLASFLFLAVPLAAQQQAPKVNWVPGPAQVDLGKVAELDLAEGYVFLNAPTPASSWRRPGTCRTDRRSALWRRPPRTRTGS